MLGKLKERSLQKQGRVYIALAVCLVSFFVIGILGRLLYNLMANEKRVADKLVVVSPHPVSFMEPLINEFEIETGIQVEVISCGTTEAIQMIEEDENVDLMWGGSVLTVGPYKDDFLSYKSNASDCLYPQFKDNSFNTNCFTDVPSVLMVNTDLIGDIKISGYEDLLQPELKGKIAFADPNKSSSSYEHLVNMLYAMGSDDSDGNANGDTPSVNSEKGFEYVNALLKQLDGNLLDSSSEVYEGVANGKYVVGLTFEEAALTMLSAGKHVRIIYMKEGVVSTPDGIYINKNTKRADDAKAFVDFMLSYDTQVYVAQYLGRRSVRTDVSNSSEVLAKAQINMIEVDRDFVIESREKWLSEFSDIEKKRRD
ncbi:extracellular solute-binding protein [Pseudobutyrivibrio sp.]|uniref:extracellular solute-binding protein n=1 Tax=Pseudobutyrivibrio sp. TaxID=2014367 RepID=UPI0025D71F3E|nr:extracellular solute-binding protein [Pseudobutyrivibrio sp.]MBR5649960.1 extracellular solute-binding protein [Pseudobutyrivibrio sp.]